MEPEEQPRGGEMTPGGEEPSQQVGWEAKVRGTQVKGGQEKTFQVEGTGRAKILGQERVWVVPRRKSREQGRARGLDRVGRGPTTQACLVVMWRSLHWILGGSATERSGGEAHDQFTFRRTFSEPSA